jgi:hypothetical protein
MIIRVPEIKKRLKIAFTSMSSFLVLLITRAESKSFLNSSVRLYMDNNTFFSERFLYDLWENNKQQFLKDRQVIPGNRLLANF